MWPGPRKKPKQADEVGFCRLGLLSVRPGAGPLADAWGRGGSRGEGLCGASQTPQPPAPPCCCACEPGSCGCGVRLWLFLPLSLLWLPWLHSPPKWGRWGCPWPPCSAVWLCGVLVLHAKRLSLIHMCVGLGPRACPVGAVMGLVAPVPHGHRSGVRGTVTAVPVQPCWPWAVPWWERGCRAKEGRVQRGDWGMGGRRWQVSHCCPLGPPRADLSSSCDSAPRPEAASGLPGRPVRAGGDGPWGMLLPSAPQRPHFPPSAPREALWPWGDALITVPALTPGAATTRGTPRGPGGLASAPAQPGACL